MQPIDYTQGLRVPDIAGNLGGGFQVGSGIRNEIDRRQQEAIARQREEQALIQQAQRAAKYETDLMAAFNDPSPQRLAQLQIAYPDRIKEFQTGFETLDKARVADEQKFIGSVYAAMRSDPKVAEKLLTDRVAALEGAGEDVTEEKRALDLLKSDPKAAQGYVGTLAAFTLPKDQIDALAKLGEETRAAELQPALARKGVAEATSAEAAAKDAAAKSAAELAKMGADLKLTKAQTNKAIIEGRKVSAEAAKINLELEALKKSPGGIPPEKAFEQEEKLRKEYTTRSQKYNEVKGSFAVIEASAKDRSGAGDIALVTAFNKVLDPGSVVRETEFANSRDTAGLLTKLQNAKQKIEKGSFLSDAQREDFRRLAEQYVKAAEEKEQKDRRALGTVVKNYGLNGDNVFGPPAQPTPNAPPLANAQPAPSYTPADVEAAMRKYGAQ